MALPPAALALVVYLHTQAPTVTWGDVPELVTAVLGGGVPHPTGYPSYLLLGRAWAALFAVGDPAWRLGVLSALCSAGAAAATAAFTLRLCRSRPAAWLAGAGLAFLPAVWHNATTAEVYGLHLLIQGAILLLWLRWEQRGGRDSPWPLALALGLGLTHHLMTLLLLPALLLALATRLPRWWCPRRLLTCALAGSLPLLVYAYLPWAAARQPAVSWGHVVTPRLFWLHVTGGAYHRYLEFDAENLSSGAQVLGESLGPVGLVLLVLAVLGAATLGQDRRLQAGLVLAWLSTAAFAMAYRVVDQAAFSLPCLQISACLAGLGTATVLARCRQRAPRALPWAYALVGVLPLAAALQGYTQQDRSARFLPHDEALGLLAAAPAHALVYTMGPEGFVPLYALEALGLRPDMELVDSMLMVRDRYPPALEALRGAQLPPGSDPQLLVARAAVDTGRPVVCLPRMEDLDWASAGLERVSLGAAHRLRLAVPRPPRVLVEPPRIESVRFEPQAAQPGQTVRVSYSWQLDPGQPPPAVAVVAMLGSEQGVLSGDDGQPLLGESHDLGQSPVHLTLPRETPPGSWRWWVALRSGDGWLTTASGERFQPSGTLEVVAGAPPLWTLPL